MRHTALCYATTTAGLILLLAVFDGNARPAGGGRCAIFNWEIAMKNYLILFALTLLAALAWRISERLSADAIGVLLGVVFGATAILPTVLVLLTASRRRERQPVAPPAYPQLPQSPVIIITGQAAERYHRRNVSNELLDKT